MKLTNKKLNKLILQDKRDNVIDEIVSIMEKQQIERQRIDFVINTLEELHDEVDHNEDPKLRKLLNAVMVLADIVIDAKK
nr:MAG TPA: hypothetical protein [Caudoviricetes sp.]